MHFFLELNKNKQKQNAKTTQTMQNCVLQKDD